MVIGMLNRPKQNRYLFFPGIRLILTLLGIVLCFLSISFSVISAAENIKVGLNKNNHEKDWGVRVIGIHRTAAGYMLDFRYRVLDAEKASSLMNRKIKPELIVEKDNRVLRVPVTSKLGPLRQSAKFVKENKNYFMFFANPGKLVQAGDKVTILIGDFKAEHIIVD
jgi:hypothetical protein